MKQLLLVSMLVAMSASAAAQEPAPAPSAPATAPNVRFEITISDEGGGAAPSRKVASLLVRGNNAPGSLRSLARVPLPGAAAVVGQAATGAQEKTPGSSPPVDRAIPLNVDVRAMLDNSGRMNASITVEYQPYYPEMKTLSSSIRTSVSALVEDGKRLLISESVDPVSGRRTTIEITATVLK